MGTWQRVLTTADDAEYKNSNASSGTSYETIFLQKRYAGLTSSTWRGSSEGSVTHTAQVFSLSTLIQTGTVPVNYSDTFMSGWVGIQYAHFQAAGDCEVDAWTATAHQNFCNMDIRLGLWKGLKRTGSVEGNYANAVQGVDFIGYIDFDADSDTSSLHPSQTITSSGNRLNATAKVLEAGDMLYVFATKKPGATGTDSQYWHVNSSIRIKHT